MPWLVPCKLHFIHLGTSPAPSWWNQRGKAQKINLFSGKNLSFVLKKKLSFQKEKMNPTMLNLKISKYSCILSKWQGSKIISPLSLHFMLYHFTVVNEMVILKPLLKSNFHLRRIFLTLSSQTFSRDSQATSKNSHCLGTMEIPR